MRMRDAIKCAWLTSGAGESAAKTRRTLSRAAEDNRSEATNLCSRYLSIVVQRFEVWVSGALLCVKGRVFNYPRKVSDSGMRSH